MLLGLSVPAFGQAEGLGSAASTDSAPPAVEFSADQVVYDSEADVITASGEVRMDREGNYLAADRSSGTVRAARF